VSGVPDVAGILTRLKKTVLLRHYRAATRLVCLWRKYEVSNVNESHGLLYALSVFHGRQVMLFTDNLAELDVISRVRSSTVSLRFVCASRAAFSCDMKLLIHVQSRNHADGPSHGYYSVALKVKPPGDGPSRCYYSVALTIKPPGEAVRSRPGKLLTTIGLNFIPFVLGLFMRRGSS
jgi:hypothetical protein